MTNLFAVILNNIIAATGADVTMIVIETVLIIGLGAVIGVFQSVINKKSGVLGIKADGGEAEAEKSEVSSEIKDEERPADNGENFEAEPEIEESEPVKAEEKTEAASVGASQEKPDGQQNSGDSLAQTTADTLMTAQAEEVAENVNHEEPDNVPEIQDNLNETSAEEKTASGPVLFDASAAPGYADGYEISENVKREFDSDKIYDPIAEESAHNGPVAEEEPKLTELQRFILENRNKYVTGAAGEVSATPQSKYESVTESGSAQPGDGFIRSESDRSELVGKDGSFGKYDDSDANELRRHILHEKASALNNDYGREKTDWNKVKEYNTAVLSVSDPCGADDKDGEKR